MYSSGLVRLYSFQAIIEQVEKITLSMRLAPKFVVNVFNKSGTGTVIIYKSYCRNMKRHSNLCKKGGDDEQKGT